MKSSSFPLTFGAFFCLTAVILGAFGAHLLKEVLTAEQLNSFETGVRYQMFHGLLLVVLGLKSSEMKLKRENTETLLIIVGTCLFSFSIYLLNMQDLLGISMKWLGPITPLGGTLLIFAWFLILLDSIQLIRVNRS